MFMIYRWSVVNCGAMIIGCIVLGESTLEEGSVMASGGHIHTLFYQ